MSSSSLPTWELIKLSGPIIFFSILLPLLDTFTDLRMIIRFYRGIPGCNATYDEIYYGEDFYFFNWQNRFTCEVDPNIYCETNPNSSECDYFDETGIPSRISGCEWDVIICERDPATFCESKPTSSLCKRFHHTIYGTMFLGNYLKKVFSLTCF